MKRFAHDLIVTRDETEDAAKSALINSSDGVNCWLIAAVLSRIAFLLFLVVIVVKCYMNHGLTIPYLLSY